MFRQNCCAILSIAHVVIATAFGLSATNEARLVAVTISNRVATFDITGPVLDSISGTVEGFNYRENYTGIRPKYEIYISTGTSQDSGITICDPRKMIAYKYLDSAEFSIPGPQGINRILPYVVNGHILVPLPLEVSGRLYACVIYGKTVAPSGGGQFLSANSPVTLDVNISGSPNTANLLNESSVEATPEESRGVTLYYGPNNNFLYWPPIPGADEYRISVPYITGFTYIGTYNQYESDRPKDPDILTGLYRFPFFGTPFGNTTFARMNTAPNLAAGVNTALMINTPKFPGYDNDSLTLWWRNNSAPTNWKYMTSRPQSYSYNQFRGAPPNYDGAFNDAAGVLASKGSPRIAWAPESLATRYRVNASYIRNYPTKIKRTLLTNYETSEPYLDENIAYTFPNTYAQDTAEDTSLHFYDGFFSFKIEYLNVLNGQWQDLTNQFHNLADSRWHTSAQSNGYLAQQERAWRALLERNQIPPPPSSLTIQYRAGQLEGSLGNYYSAIVKVRAGRRVTSCEGGIYVAPAVPFLIKNLTSETTGDINIAVCSVYDQNHISAPVITTHHFPEIVTQNITLALLEQSIPFPIALAFQDASGAVVKDPLNCTLGGAQSNCPQRISLRGAAPFRILVNTPSGSNLIPDRCSVNGSNQPCRSIQLSRTSPNRLAFGYSGITSPIFQFAYKFDVHLLHLDSLKSYFTNLDPLANLARTISIRFKAIDGDGNTIRAANAQLRNNELVFEENFQTMCLGGGVCVHGFNVAFLPTDPIFPSYLEISLFDTRGPLAITRCAAVGASLVEGNCRIKAGVTVTQNLQIPTTIRMGLDFKRSSDQLGTTHLTLTRPRTDTRSGKIIVTVTDSDFHQTQTKSCQLSAGNLTCAPISFSGRAPFSIFLHPETVEHYFSPVACAAIGGQTEGHDCTIISNGGNLTLQTRMLTRQEFSPQESHPDNSKVITSNLVTPTPTRFDFVAGLTLAPLVFHRDTVVRARFPEVPGNLFIRKGLKQTVRDALGNTLKEQITFPEFYLHRNNELHMLRYAGSAAPSTLTWSIIDADLPGEPAVTMTDCGSHNSGGAVRMIDNGGEIINGNCVFNITRMSNLGVIQVNATTLSSAIRTLNFVRPSNQLSTLNLGFSLDPSGSVAGAFNVDVIDRDLRKVFTGPSCNLFAEQPSCIPSAITVTGAAPFHVFVTPRDQALKFVEAVCLDPNATPARAREVRQKGCYFVMNGGVSTVKVKLTLLAQ